MRRPNRALALLLILFSCANGRADDFDEKVKQVSGSVGKVIFAIPTFRDDIVNHFSKDPQKAAEAKKKRDEDAAYAAGYVLVALGLSAAERLLVRAGNVQNIDRHFTPAANGVVPPQRGPRLVVISFGHAELAGTLMRVNTYLRAGAARLLGNEVKVVEVRNRDEFIKLLQQEAAAGNTYSHVEINTHGTAGTIWFRDMSKLELSELKNLPEGSVAVTNEGGTWHFRACAVGAGCKDASGNEQEKGAYGLLDLLGATAPDGGDAVASRKNLAMASVDVIPLPPWLKTLALHATGIYLPYRFGGMFFMSIMGLLADKRFPGQTTYGTYTHANYNPNKPDCPFNAMVR